MHDLARMGVGDRGADPQQQAAARRQVEPVVVRMGEQMAAVDEFHRDVRRAVGGFAGVDERGDARMPQALQYLALQHEAAAQRRVVAIGAQQLQRDRDTVRIGGDRAIHRAHAAAADAVEQAPAADAAALPVVVAAVQRAQSCRHAPSRRVAVAEGRIGGEQIAQTCRQRRVGGRECIELRARRGRFEFDELGEPALHFGRGDGAAARAAHVRLPRRSASQARA